MLGLSRLLGTDVDEKISSALRQRDDLHSRMKVVEDRSLANEITLKSKIGMGGAFTAAVMVIAIPTAAIAYLQFSSDRGAEPAKQAKAAETADVSIPAQEAVAERDEVAQEE